MCNSCDKPKYTRYSFTLDVDAFVCPLCAYEYSVGMSTDDDHAHDDMCCGIVGDCAFIPSTECMPHSTPITGPVRVSRVR